MPTIAAFGPNFPQFLGSVLFCLASDCAKFSLTAFLSLQSLSSFMFFPNYSSSRLQVAGRGDVSADQSIGSPQGSPLSPLLWNIGLRLLETPLSAGVHIQAYANDTILVVSGSQQQELKQLSELTLSRVCEWATSVKLRLNAAKCF